MEAFKDSRLVWDAIFSISAMIFSMFWVVALIFFMASTSSSIFFWLLAASIPTFFALSCTISVDLVFSSTWPVTSSTVATSSSTDAAWLVAPSAISCALTASWLLPADTCSEESWIPCMVSLILFTISSSSSRTFRSCPTYASGQLLWTSKLPSENCSTIVCRSDTTFFKIAAAVSKLSESLPSSSSDS